MVKSNLRGLTLALCLTSASLIAAQQTPSAPTLPTPAGGAAIVQPADPATTSVAAQCPQQVGGAFNATALICSGLTDGDACLGNGIVESTAREGVEVSFDQPADRTPLANLQSLRLRTTGTDNALWAVIVVKALLAIDSSQQPASTLVAFGDVSLTDDADVVTVAANQRIGTVIADFGLIVRNAPDATGGVVYQLQSGENVTVTGQTADKTWLRIQIPTEYSAPGWVYSPYMNVTGGQETLPYVDPASAAPARVAVQSIEFTNMQALRLETGATNTECAATPPSGILLQSPDGVSGNVRTRINDVVIEFNGSLFVSASRSASMTVTILEGTATLEASGATSDTVTGQIITIPMSADLTPTGGPVPDVAALEALSSLPVSLLPRVLALAGSETAAEIVATPAPPEVTAVVGVDGTLPTPVVAAATAEPITSSLISRDLGEVCGVVPAVVITEPATPVGVTTNIGGVWTATNGTTIVFEVSGGTFQPTFGNYLRLNATTGIVAQSGEATSLTYTFTADTSFSATFSSKAGDELSVTVRCL